ncbi:proliferating cell nuclear antigen, N-terminal domain-containing protein [Suillus fuscotomentosus]|uniref:DNA sliding clamp PCNA n=1 Tax=Suillus fuscotomentosus TaxID=1912939 RepID=A0AAD4E150_9AGAM|nr:proliferating cell nuclear antigen, N-terminal domain-containing protein [Suillus fuscotomentosus]KAG1897818.1 proliferating cell nuclear antigen, N-terminal domain-containing protein [Suillus fuscotomentosus]
MLEARLQEAALLKRLLDSIKELVTDANFECNEEGINLQAMDNSHVALVAVKLEATGFKKYRCDRPMPLGVNLNSLTKVLKCAKDDDICIIKASDDADVLNLVYEARSSDRIAEYDMKLMDIDAETLGIPDTEYDARVTMTASEFTRIVRDLSQLGESVRIEVSKEGVRFASEGEAANGNVLLKQTEAAREKYANYGKEDEEAKEEDDEDDEEGSSSKKKIKKEKNMKKEDADVEMEGEDEDDEQEEFKPKSDDEGEEEQDEDEEDKKSSKKRKKAPAKSNGKAAKKVKKSDETPTDGGVLIEMNQHVSLTFSLKYLVNFSKSSALSNTVQLMMSNDVPLLVSYKFGQGEIKYYLAPKIGEE